MLSFTTHRLANHASKWLTLLIEKCFFLRMIIAFNENDDEHVIQAVIKVARGIREATEEPRKAATAQKIEHLLRHACQSQVEGLLENQPREGLSAQKTTLPCKH